MSLRAKTPNADIMISPLTYADKEPKSEQLTAWDNMISQLAKIDITIIAPQDGLA